MTTVDRWMPARRYPLPHTQPRTLDDRYRKKASRALPQAAAAAAAACLVAKAARPAAARPTCVCLPPLYTSLGLARVVCFHTPRRTSSCALTTSRKRPSSRPVGGEGAPEAVGLRCPTTPLLVRPHVAIPSNVHRGDVCVVVVLSIPRPPSPDRPPHILCMDSVRWGLRDPSRGGPLLTCMAHAAPCATRTSKQTVLALSRCAESPRCCPCVTSLTTPSPFPQQLFAAQHRVVGGRTHTTKRPPVLILPVHMMSPAVVLPGIPDQAQLGRKLETQARIKLPIGVQCRKSSSPDLGSPLHHVRMSPPPTTHTGR